MNGTRAGKPARKESTLVLLLLIGIVLALAALVVWMFVRGTRPYGAIETWPKAARRMGLVHRPFEIAGAVHPGTIEGTYRGHRVRIEPLGKVGRVDQMLVTVHFRNPLPGDPAAESDVALRDELADRTRQDVRTENPEFDRVFHPRAVDVMRGTRILGDPHIQGMLRELAAQGRGVRMDELRLQYFGRTIEPDPKKLQEILDRIVILADGMEHLGK